MSSDQESNKVKPLDYGQNAHQIPPVAFPPHSNPTTTTTVVTTIAPGQVYFNELDPNYQTCCCHVRVAVLIIAILDIVGQCSTLAYSIKALAAPSSSDNLGAGFSTFSLISCFVRLTIATLGICAVKHTKPVLLLPYCIVQGIYVFAILPVVILYSLLLAFGVFTLSIEYYNPYTHQYVVNYGAITFLAGILAVIMIIAFAFGIWFFLIFIRCHKYLKAKQDWLSRIGANAAGYSQQAVYATPVYHLQQPGPVYPAAYLAGPASSQQPWASQPPPPPPYQQ